MAKIDVYLRSVEKFGASGAILTSGQAITLRLPQGDRNATQVTPHDQLVALVREVAPPAALAAIDGGRPAKFEIDSAGTRYSLEVHPKPNVWQVVIAAATSAAPARESQPMVAVQRSAPAAADPNEMVIERGQYADGPSTSARAASGSATLDQWTTSARSARATDVYLATGANLVARINGDLQQLGDRGALDAETISRELGVVAPADARAAWTEHGTATFTYSDGMGRVRATLTRDHRGPGAALRLLVGEAPALDRLGIGREVGGWLQRRGLILVAGPSGVGKTTTLAALVRALGERPVRVVTLEDPIEIIATSPWVSQRAIGEHVPSVIAGVAAALLEGADAIVVGTITSADAATAVLDAVTAGHLVLATISVATAAQAAAQLTEWLPHERRDLARNILATAHLGTIAPVVKGGSRSYEVMAGAGG